MGSSQSAQQQQPSGFNVRVRFLRHRRALCCVTMRCVAAPTLAVGPRLVAQMSNAILEKTGVSGDAGPNASENEALKRAFEQGAEYATQQIAQMQTEQAAATAHEEGVSLQKANEQNEQLVRERIEALQRREYRCASPAEGAPP
jgi:hypothetical protein